MGETMGTSQWYYVKDGTQRGPIDESDLSRLIQHGALPPETPVFQDGLGGDWTAANTTGVFPLNATIAPIAQARPPRALIWSMAAALVTLLITGILLFNQQEKKSQEALADQEQKLFLLTQELASNTDVLGKHQNELDNTQNTTDLLDVENAQLKAQIDALTTNLNKASGDLEALQTTAKNMQSQFAQTSTLYAQSKDQLKILETQANAQAEENKQLQTQLQAQRNNPGAGNAQTATQLRAALSALNSANQKVDLLTHQLAQVGRPSPAAPSPPPVVTHLIPSVLTAPAPPRPIAVKPPTTPGASEPIGSVVTVDARAGFAVINIGTRHGVKKNDRFIVKSKTTGLYVGTLRISNSMEEVAAADLGRLPIQTLTPGDTLHPIAP
jgi:hypothetical protein